jgi:hypothetical protein
MVCQCPVPSQDCTVLPEQRGAVPGEHSPPQSPVVGSQTNAHAVAAAQLPSPSQVCTMLLAPMAHRVAPGLQSPAQAPSRQKLVQGWPA